MSYLLRIINQNLAQSESATNWSLECEDYRIIYKVNNAMMDEGLSLFERSLAEYLEGTPYTAEEKESIRVIIYGKNRTHVVHDYEVAFIVNDKGQTLERVYGMYEKR